MSYTITDCVVSDDCMVPGGEPFCMGVCSFDAISIVAMGEPVTVGDQCIECAACAMVCPRDSLDCPGVAAPPQPPKPSPTISALVGEVRLFARGAAPENFTRCDGRTLDIGHEQKLFTLVGATYGGNGVTEFKVPDLRAAEVGLGEMSYYIANSKSNFPATQYVEDCTSCCGSSDYTIGSVVLFACDFTPRGFLPCDGKSYKIYDLHELMAVIGWRFGGQPGPAQEFSVPDLRDSTLTPGVGYFICARGVFPSRD